MAQALVPLKDLVQAKTRLAGLLRPSERRALAQAMVEDVLTVLAQHRQVSQVTLVSDDPGATLLAEKYGAHCWSENALGCRGLNAVVRSASERLLGAGDEPLVVLHGDLPLLASADITEVLNIQSQIQGLVIGCDKQGKGTNLLAFAVAPRFCFGVDSCARHFAAARDSGVPVQVLSRQGIGVDVDEARDLQVLMTNPYPGAKGHTYELLHGTDLGTRLELALATLSEVVGEGCDEGNVDRGLVN